LNVSAAIIAGALVIAATVALTSHWSVQSISGRPGAYD
jgi:hypothetical protein